jgi:hypothetical protein
LSNTENLNDETVRDFNLVIDLPSIPFQFTLKKEYDFSYLFQSNETNEEEVSYQRPNPDYPQCKYYVDGAKLQQNFPNYPTIPIDWKNEDPIKYCVETRNADNEPTGSCEVVDGNDTPYGDNYYVTYCIANYQLTASRYTQKYPNPVDGATVDNPQPDQEEEGPPEEDPPAEEPTQKTSGFGDATLSFNFNLNQVAFTQERAQAIFQPNISGGFSGGIYLNTGTWEGYPEPGAYIAKVYLEDFYDVSTLTKKENPTFQDYPPLKWYLPQTPVTDSEEIEHNVKNVLFDGEYLGNNAEGAGDEFDKLVSDCTELREPVSAIEQKGVFKIAGKNGAILFQTPIYAKKLVPINGLVLTYTIKRFNWDPPTEG